MSSIYTALSRLTLNLIKTQHCSFHSSFHTYSTSYTHATSGLLSWTMELLTFASRQYAPKIVDLSVRFIRILFYRYPFL